jgi:riboflavin kinase/FMN adenylyltransferase
MITHTGSESLPPDFPPACVVALGNFDGVHLGHQAIFERARSHAVRLGIPLVCYTFQPHPTLELKPQSPLKLLMTYDEKRELIATLGVDRCVEERFTLEFSQTTAADFFHHILLERLHARVIVVGTNFNFGRNREGSTRSLEEGCRAAGVSLEAVPPLEWEGRAVSSSRIRESLSKGDVRGAAQMLGRSFFYRSEVVHGDKRGRTIGFPTANMRCADKFPLRPGVYASSILWQGVEHPSVTNIGTRPTFDASELRIETHILDRDFDLYGEKLEVRFHERIRDERKFSSIDELKQQIASDVILAKDIVSLPFDE